MKSLTRHIIRLLFVLWLGLILAKPALARLPASPPETDTLQNVHQAGSGFLLIKHKYATFNISPYITIRYLNQKAIKDSYTESFGRTFELDKCHDLIFQKVVLYFKGWVASPDFKYFLYTWSSNANQEQGTQVVIGGNMQYQLSKYLDPGAGIGSLPTSRSVLGNWPFRLRQDARPMADEFFRGSFTMEIWAQGEIANGLSIKPCLATT